MTSPAQMKSNAENAKKSTGPRTAAGKERARTNAIKHGMTARVVLLPEENVREFKLRMIGIFEDLRPKSRLESALAGARCLFVRAPGAGQSRRRSARMCRKARHGCSGGSRSDGARGSRANADAVSAASGTACCSSVRRTTRRTTGGSSRGRRQRQARPSGIVVGRLEGSALGCHWVRDRWSELRALLEDGLKWRAPERFARFGFWEFTRPTRSLPMS